MRIAPKSKVHKNFHKCDFNFTIEEIDMETEPMGEIESESTETNSSRSKIKESVDPVGIQTPVSATEKLGKKFGEDMMKNSNISKRLRTSMIRSVKTKNLNILRKSRKKRQTSRWLSI